MGRKKDRRRRSEDATNSAAPVPVEETLEPQSVNSSRWFYAVLAVAVLVRAGYLALYLASPLHGYLVVDHELYINWGRQIAQGDIFYERAFEQGPLYAYSLGLIFAAIGDRLVWLYVLQLVIGVAGVTLCYLSAKRLFDTKTALIASGLMALFGPLVFYECMAMKSFLSPFFTLCILYFGTRYRDEKRWYNLAAIGVAGGLACLVRENHVLLLVVAAVWVWWSDRDRLKHQWRRAGVALLPIVVGVACLLPATIHNWVVAKELILVTSGGGEVFYMGHGPAADGYYRAPDFVRPHPLVEHEDFRREAERRTGHAMSQGGSSRYWLKEAIAYAVSHPVHEVGLLYRRFAILLNDFEVSDSENYRVYRTVIPLLALLPTFGWISGLGLIGAVICLRWPKQNGLILGLAFAHIVSILATYNFGRFRLGLTPLWAIFAGVAIVWILRQWKTGSGKQKRYAMLAAVVAIAISAASFLPPPGLRISADLIDYHTHLARLANRRQAFELADEHFILALQEMEILEQLEPEDRGNQTALLAQKFGKDWVRLKQYDRAVALYRFSIEAPNEDKYREVLLRDWLALLRQSVREQVPLAEIPDPQREMARTLKRLRTIRPDEVSYWALSAAFPGETPIQTIEQKLQQFEAEAGKQSKEAAGWLATGWAFFYWREGDKVKSVDYARDSLKHFEKHPWELEVRRISEGEKPDSSG